MRLLATIAAIALLYFYFESDPASSGENNLVLLIGGGVLVLWAFTKSSQMFSDEAPTKSEVGLFTTIITFIKNIIAMVIFAIILLVAIPFFMN